MTATNTSQELDTISTVAIAVKEGTIASYDELIKKLAGPAQPDKRGTATAPAPVALTQGALDAASKLPEVFGKVHPSTPRKLTAPEIEQLFEERGVIDALVKELGTRKDTGIREIVANHFDRVYEETVDAEQAADQEVDDKGHYLNANKAPIPNTTKQFSREVRDGSPSLTEADLLALEKNPDVDFTHDDYLAMTTLTRVVDQAKVMLHLRKRPEVVNAIAVAAKPGKKTASIYVR